MRKLVLAFACLVVILLGHNIWRVFNTPQANDIMDAAEVEAARQELLRDIGAE